MNWHGKRVLVTGAGGFIGSHLTHKLATLGAETRAMVHYRGNGSWGWLDEDKVRNDVEVVPGDVRDRETVKQAMQGIDIVFHLAALIAIPYSYQAPISYLRTNAEGTANVLQVAREEEVERFIHASTSEVYGTARYVPIDEEHPLQGQTPYSASKIAADKFAEAYYYSFGVPVTIARPFNVFGPRQSARAVIPAIITQALTQPEIRLGNIEPTRDFTYVEDTVDGYIRVGETPAAIGQTINIGCGQEISIGDLVTLILELLGSKDIPIVLDSDRVRMGNSEVDRLCADNQRAKDILGWSPKISFRDGLSLTIDWIKSNLDEFRAAYYAV